MASYDGYHYNVIIIIRVLKFVNFIDEENIIERSK